MTKTFIISCFVVQLCLIEILKSMSINGQIIPFGGGNYQDTSSNYDKKTNVGKYGRKIDDDNDDELLCTFMHAKTNKVLKTESKYMDKNGQYCRLQENEGLVGGELYVTYLTKKVKGKSMLIGGSPVNDGYNSKGNYKSPTLKPTKEKSNYVVDCQFADLNTYKMLKTEKIRPMYGEKCVLTQKDGLKPGDKYMVTLVQKYEKNGAGITYTEEEYDFDVTESPTERNYPRPTGRPTVRPTVRPTGRGYGRTREPTMEPTVEPTLEPTLEPSIEPTIEPTTEPTNTDICFLPKDVGPCTVAPIPRYYFNGTHCELFGFSGCGGNANNFENITACLDACGHNAVPGNGQAPGGVTGRLCAKCNDLDPQTNQVVFTTIPVNTFDISGYTCGQIKLLTTFGGQGNLHCTDEPNSITFEVLKDPNDGWPANYTHAMRVLFGGGPPVISGDCCNSTNPYNVCNAPDQEPDLIELCKNLGYSNAYEYIYHACIYIYMSTPYTYKNIVNLPEHISISVLKQVMIL